MWMLIDGAETSQFLTGSAIRRKHYIVETLTPMAMHGTNSCDNPQFRITSLRGLLRYWWRAVQYEADPEKLLSKEEALFGGTQTEQKGRSLLRLSVQPKLPDTKKYPLLNHKTEGKSFTKAIKPSHTLSMEASTYRLTEPETWTHFQDVLELMLLLTGMGQRARRGFGAVQWQEHRFDSVEAYGQRLCEVLGNLNVSTISDITAGCLVKTSFNSEQLPPHPTLTAVWIGKPYKNDDACMGCLLTDYGRASHLRSGPSLGGINPRFASPLWGSVRKIDDRLYPVISELQSAHSLKTLTVSYEADRNAFLHIMGVNI
jgi:CRISPR-associated protein Cmr1